MSQRAQLAAQRDRSLAAPEAIVALRRSRRELHVGRGAGRARRVAAAASGPERGARRGARALRARRVRARRRLPLRAPARRPGARQRAPELGAPRAARRPRGIRGHGREDRRAKGVFVAHVALHDCSR